MRLHQSQRKLIYMLIPLCALLGACAPDDAQKKVGATPEGMFTESCGACHSVEDNGPTVAELRALSAEELRAGIRNHPTAGDISDRLSAARIDELIKYLEQQ